ncbi:hypothetical protein [Jannaschia pohangensis]|uniref:Uncharacterized protein n=1 Tax=Jannaschia pohangensis TaxID=390807 RepID=A0A1I3MHP8_9RHOB|nr:hypothetical protein [Jannaschia pohangensis]SFI96216.1 hypothetical protein SAMN04488095_1846 [Jannaschia pohangensis]
MEQFRTVFSLFLTVFAFGASSVAAQTDRAAIEDVATGFIASFARMAVGPDTIDDLDELDGLDEQASAAMRELRRDIGKLVHYSVIFECAADLRADVWDKTRPYIVNEVTAVANPLVTGGFERFLNQKVIDTTAFAFADADTPLGMLSRMVGGISGSRERFQAINDVIVKAAIQAATDDECGASAFLIQENALLFSVGLPPISLEGLQAFRNLRLVTQEDVPWGPDAFGPYQAPKIEHEAVQAVYDDYLQGGPLDGAQIRVCRYESPEGAAFSGVARESLWPHDIPIQDERKLLWAHGLSREIGTNRTCTGHPDIDAESDGYIYYYTSRATVIRRLEAQLVR